MSTYKHDFRITDKKIHIPPLKRVPQTEGGCMCLECQKNALMAEQVSRRIKGYQGTQDVNPSSTRHKMEMPAVDHADSNPNIGKFIRSPKAVNIYKSMGGAVKRVAKPNTYIGKIESVNSKGNWFKLTNDGGYVFNSSDLNFNTPDPVKPLTEKQKEEILYDVAKSAPVMGGANPILIGEDVKSGADELGKALSKYKWYLIAILLVLLLAVFLRVKG